MVSVSLWLSLRAIINHRDTENTEVAQRRNNCFCNQRCKKNQRAGGHGGPPLQNFLEEFWGFTNFGCLLEGVGNTDELGFAEGAGEEGDADR